MIILMHSYTSAHHYFNKKFLEEKLGKSTLKDCKVLPIFSQQQARGWSWDGTLIIKTYNREDSSSLLEYLHDHFKYKIHIDELDVFKFHIFKALIEENENSNCL